MSTAELLRAFEAVGGRFLTPPEALAAKLRRVRGYLFDWDGVFNAGIKGAEGGSPFAEPDAMGTNMLRFSHWLQHGELPVVAIMTGENNAAARHLAEREHFDAVVLRAKRKDEALRELADTHCLRPEQFAFVFDDIIDLPACRITGLNLCVRRPAGPLFLDYVARHGLADYVTGHPGGAHAVRELTELLIALRGNGEATITKRIDFAGDYERYLAGRNAGPPRVLDLGG
ncbi:MAG: phosphatase [Catalinimonas sp.]